MPEEIYFKKEDVFDTISEILTKNGIEESLADSAEKIVETGTSWITVVFRLVKERTKEKITEKDFVISLKNQLSVPDEAAKNIYREIEEKILPFAEKVEVGNYNQKQGIEKKSANITTVRPITQKQSGGNIPTPNQESIGPLTNLPKPVRKKQKIMNNINDPSANKKATKSPAKKQDSYREPIE